VIRAILLALPLLLPGPAPAQPARPVAEPRESNATDAARRVAAAGRVQAAERAMAMAEARLAEANRAEAAARGEETQAAEALAPLLPLLLRLARQPEAALLAAPASPVETRRALLLLRAALREAEELAEAHLAAREATGRAAMLRDEARRLLATAEAENQAAIGQLDAELEQAARQRAQANDPETRAARRAQETAARARSLGEAMLRLDREARPRPPPPEAARGGVPEAARAWPVVGQVARAFGAPGDGGPARGVTLAAAAGARVVSPCPGRVAFAGPFRSYGRIVILECGSDHVVLAGLAKLDTSAGEHVLAGEPLGTLPGGGTGAATLYMELRRGGEPTDPRAWLRP
jgi:septal ring factor EnvC (AmiA/AmiB activator)